MAPFILSLTLLVPLPASASVKPPTDPLGPQVHQLAEFLSVAGDAFLADLHAARTAVMESLAPPPPEPVRTPYGASQTVSGACGGATNGADRFIARESGGDPNIWNTQGSGAYGCYQIMPGTWNSSCGDLGTHGNATVEAQAACASRLPLSAWGG